MNVRPGDRLHGITGVHLPDGRTVDITFDGGVVADVLLAGSVAPVTTGTPGRTETGTAARSTVRTTARGNWIDLSGYTVFPAAADPHAHLDKALSWDVIDPPAGDLDAAIRSWVEASDRFTEDDILDRARRAALMMLAAGTTAVRTHVDIYRSTGPGADPYRGVRALNRLRDELAGTMTLQLVALVPAHTPDDLLVSVTEGALDAGADLVGGAPHLAADPLAQTDALLDVAEARGVGCDLHTDEFLDPPAPSDGSPAVAGTRTVRRYAERVRGWPAGRIRGAGHCCRLSQEGPEELAETAARLRDAGIHVIALPATNLYLQGGDGVPVPHERGVAPVSVLRELGVAVSAGGDNVRDPFNPTGRADPLETASLLVTACHQSPGQALDLVTRDARAALGLPPAGPFPGAAADLLCIRDPVSAPGTVPSVASFIAAAPTDRTVISAGRLASQSRTTVELPRAFGPDPRADPADRADRADPVRQTDPDPYLRTVH